MFSWFKKGSVKKAPSNATKSNVDSAEAPTLRQADARSTDDPELRAVVARWDAALAATQATFAAELEAAVQASQPLVETVSDDLQPLSQPWNIFEPRRSELHDELSDTWETLSDEMAECESCDEHVMAREGGKLDATTTELELALERAYTTVMAEGAQRMLSHALAKDVASHTCLYCGATLDRVTPVAHSLNVECGYCNAVNTVNPGDAMRLFSGTGARYLAKLEALPHREAMARAENALGSYRNRKDVPFDLLQALETASHNYYATLYGTEATYVPEQRQYVAKKVESHHGETRRTLQRYPQWRAQST